MQADAIERMIAAAFDDESRTGRVADLMRGVAAKDGRVVGDAEVQEAVGFVRDYVRNVPHLMREALAASAGTYAESKMASVLAAATAYWEAHDDVIPDRLGLMGIMDDAYCSLCLLQALSDRFASETGTPLVRQDLSKANQAIRQLLGDPAAERLDDYVEDALLDTVLSELLASLADSPAPPPPPANSVWPDEPIDDLVAQLLHITVGRT